MVQSSPKNPRNSSNLQPSPDSEMVQHATTGPSICGSPGPELSLRKSVSR